MMLARAKPHTVDIDQRERALRLKLKARWLRAAASADPGLGYCQPAQLLTTSWLERHPQPTDAQSMAVTCP